ncbi:hypothetical protein [Roseomonas sp. WA12]
MSGSFLDFSSWSERNRRRFANGVRRPDLDAEVPYQGSPMGVLAASSPPTGALSAPAPGLPEQLPLPPPAEPDLSPLVRGRLDEIRANPSVPAPSAPSPAPAMSAPNTAPSPSGDPSRLPRGLRNNNPLNIEAGDLTAGLPGFAGSDGRFARFETQEQGLAAADRLLQTYSTKHGLNTVAGIIGRWAPASDGNNVSSYAMNVARKLGVDPNAPIDMTNPDVRRRLAEGMAEHENGRGLSSASGVRLASNSTSASAPPARGDDATPIPDAASPTIPAASRSSFQLPPETPQEPAERGMLGISSDGWFSLASGLFGGRTLSEGLSLGLKGVASSVKDARQERRIVASEAERRALARAQLSLSAENAQLGRDDARARLALSERGLASQERRAERDDLRADEALALRRAQVARENDPRGVQSSIGYRAADGTPIRAQQMRNGDVAYVDQAGKPVTDVETLRGMVRDDQFAAGISGASAARGEGAQRGQDAAERFTTDSGAWESAQNTLDEIGRIRATAGAERFTGPAVQQRVKRFMVDNFGVEVDGVTPTGLSLGRQAIEALSQGKVRASLAGQGAVSNFEREQAARAIAGMANTPQALDVLLDLEEKSAQRQLRLRDDWRSLGAAGQRAVRTAGSYADWRNERIEQYAAERGVTAGSNTPSVQRTAPGQYQTRSSTGVGFTFNP